MFPDGPCTSLTIKKKVRKGCSVSLLSLYSERKPLRVFLWKGSNALRRTASNKQPRRDRIPSAREVAGVAVLHPLSSSAAELWLHHRTTKCRAKQRANRLLLTPSNSTCVMTVQKSRCTAPQQGSYSTIPICGQGIIESGFWSGYWETEAWKNNE